MIAVYNVLIKEFILYYDKIETPVDVEGNSMPIAAPKEYFSFIYDTELIYAGFIQVYSIDLMKQKRQSLLEGI